MFCVQDNRQEGGQTRKATDGSRESVGSALPSRVFEQLLSSFLTKLSRLQRLNKLSEDMERNKLTSNKKSRREEKRREEKRRSSEERRNRVERVS